MKRAILAVAFAVLAGTILHAKDASRHICPSGYSPIGEVCISDTTGDIVLPDKVK